MKFKLYDDPADYWALARDWEGLLKASGIRSVFLTPQWVGLSYEYFAAEAECLLLTAWENGQLVGAFPFALRGDALRFSADEALTDHSDVVVLPERRREVLSSLGPFLRAFFGREFLVSLEPLRGGSPNLQLLVETLEAEKEPVAAYYSVRLPKSVDELDYRLIKSKDLKLLHRRTDKMLRRGEVEVELLGEPVEIAENLDDLFWMFISGGPEAHRFLTPEREAFLREVIPLLAKAGLVELFYLRLNGTRVAGHLAFHVDGSALLFMSGETGEALELAPGVILLKAILDHYVENSVVSVDFPRGREAFKKVFGPKEEQLYRVVRGKAEASPDVRPETALNW